MQAESAGHELVPGVLVPFAEGVWLDTGPAHFLGLRLTTTMAVLRLAGDGLLVWSPVALTAARRAAVERLGVVRHLYAPNLFHHLALAEWAEAFPQARLHAPAALAAKRPDLRIDRAHGAASDPELEGFVDELPIDGCRLGETALLYRPSRTLLVADLVHNVGRPTHTWTALYTRAAGFYDRIALSRVLRWTAFPQREHARHSVERILERPFDRVVLGHGAPIEADAHERVASAYAWLLGRAPGVAET